jgi:multicopper oxidase
MARHALSFAATISALLALCACGPGMPADSYDRAKMDLKPVPAKVSAERHKGTFAEGAALSTSAQLKPLDPSPVKTVRLDTTHKIIEIAPGVKFSAWTFGDRVPGPTIRARVGDKIRFSMTNRSDEPVRGAQLAAAPMMHSMAFHAAMVSPQDKYRSIAPGQTIEFEFTLNYCVEDKVAAVYDHAVVTQALAAKRVVVFLRSMAHWVTQGARDVPSRTSHVPREASMRLACGYLWSSRRYRLLSTLAAPRWPQSGRPSTAELPRLGCHF